MARVTKYISQLDQEESEDFEWKLNDIKEAGNQIFQMKDYRGAIQKFKEGIVLY